MKFLKYLLYILLLLGLVLVAVGLFLPAKTEVERSIVIEADASTVYSLISDFKEFNRWSPWVQDDPNLNIDYAGPHSGLGAVMTWTGEDATTVVGQQEIVIAEPYRRVEMAMELGNAMKAKSLFVLDSVDEATKVTWRFEAVHGLNLVQRYVGLALEERVGSTYERGLTNLKNLAESLPGIVTEEVSYSVGETDFTGLLAMPRDAQNAPGVLVVHEWWGHNDYVRDRAKMLAELGYVAFALDMYGDGKLAEHPEDAQKFMMEVVDNADVAKARFEAALAVLKSQPQADQERTAAIGYCFGGAVVLSMARAGADLDGVVSFHGALGNLAPVAEDVDAKFLVLHGGADPFISEEQEQSFKDSMDAEGLDYQFVEYDGVKHAFTNPEATAKGEKFNLPLEYNAEADADSWQRMQNFLTELFK